MTTEHHPLQIDLRRTQYLKLHISLFFGGVVITWNDEHFFFWTEIEIDSKVKNM